MHFMHNPPITSTENLQLLCGSCNRIKGDRSMEYLKIKLQLR